MSSTDVLSYRSGNPILRALRGFFARLDAARHRRETMRHLSRLSDRELADIGITRAMIHEIAEATSAPSRS